MLEDNPTDAELAQELLEADQLVCEVTRVQTRAEFLTGLESDRIGLILADYMLPSFDGISALKLALKTRLSRLVPCVVPCAKPKKGPNARRLRTRCAGARPSFAR